MSFGSYGGYSIAFCIICARTKRDIGPVASPRARRGPHRSRCRATLSLKEIYSPSGPLSRLPGWEPRPQQIEVALAVEAFLRAPGSTTLAVEAPTGVGKTFAVLVPALREAVRRGAHILFLTAGIALQEQLIEKDLPRLRELLGLGVSFGLLKGRERYACLRRARGAGAGPTLFDAPGATEGLARWLDETETGDLAELSLDAASPALRAIAAGARGCAGTGCPFRDRCFVIRAYRRAQDQEIVVANYALFFSHIIEGAGAFPVRYDWLICDEAHRLPDAARSSSTIRVGAEAASALLGPRLHASMPFLKAQGVDADVLSARAAEARSGLAGLFEILPSRLPGDGGLQIADELLLSRGRAVSEDIALLLRALRPFEDRFEAGGFADRAQLAQAAELMGWIDDVRGLDRALSWCLSVERFPSWAYWGEAGPRGAALTSRPVRAAEIVRDALEREDPEKAVFMSATLALSGSFDHWSRESGVEAGESIVVGSPFDLRKQMELLVVDVGLRVGERGYDERMCRVMEGLCDENGGRTLVLLSSLRLMEAFARKMRERDRPYAVLVQNDMPQRQLLRRFTEDETSVLIGSVSFREGVDVPGEGLTQVIIDRIPFPHPNDPVVRARDVLEGGKGFARVTLPTARMFLRQAAGRLIRSSSDHGRVVLLDARAADRKEWGILSSLPACRVRRLSVEEAAEARP